MVALPRHRLHDFCGEPCASIAHRGVPFLLGRFPAFAVALITLIIGL